MKCHSDLEYVWNQIGLSFTNTNFVYTGRGLYPLSLSHVGGNLDARNFTDGSLNEESLTLRLFRREKFSRRIEPPPKGILSEIILSCENRKFGAFYLILWEC